MKYVCIDPGKLTGLALLSSENGEQPIIEEALELPLIKKGFNSIEDFIARAQTILQRRKARSGRSLELQTRHILVDINL